MDSCEAPGGCRNAPLDFDVDGQQPRACGGTDCDDSDASVYLNAPELCDRVDNNCNGTTDEGCPALPDTCANASAVTLDAAGVGSVTDRFDAFANDYSVNALCSPGTGGRDAVYYVDVPSGTHDLTVDTIGSSTDTMLGVGVDCSATGLRAICHDDLVLARNQVSRIWVHRVAGPTRLYVLVDGFDSAQLGSFTLNVRRTAATPDTCGPAITLPLDISGGGHVLGFQNAIADDQRGSCQGLTTPSPEAVFRVRPASTTPRFRVFSQSFVPSLYLRQDPCASGSELACQLGTAPVGGGANRVEINPTVVAGDLHWLFVEGGPGGYALYSP